jgi:hypothetical protein
MEPWPLVAMANEVEVGLPAAQMQNHVSEDSFPQNPHPLHAI